MREPLRSFVLVALLCATLAWLEPLSGLEGMAQLGIALVFLFFAVHGAEKNGGLEAHGIALGGLLGGAQDDTRSLARVLLEGMAPTLRELGVALALSLLVFPPFVLAYVGFHGLSGSYTLVLPDDLAGFLLSHLLLVALPEEAYFRGYLQTRLDAALGGPRLPGAAVGARALLLQALLFALVHIATEPHPARMAARAATFFPALVFGYLRAKRGGVGAAVFFHFACNLLAELLFLGMR